ncbi:MAG: VCBS repeat-containing protein [Gemmatimonadota bacterium]|nr:VCBS repeat-containing protein [Gemmatimonadota bacterium]
MKLRHASIGVVGTLLVVGATAASVRPAPAPRAQPANLLFTEHAIDSGLSGGYQVVVADMNRDGKPDVIALASNLHELRWYENPGWQRHVIISGIDAPINAAAYDIDGDGIPEIALAHAFDTDYAKSVGIVSILSHHGDPTAPWTERVIDHLPTSHRLRFVDVDGTGRRVLVNFPLIGHIATAPQYRDHVPFVMYRPGEWKREMITEADEGVVHGIFQSVWAEDDRESLLSASFLGVHLMRYDKGQWTRTKLLAGLASFACLLFDHARFAMESTLGLRRHHVRARCLAR